MGLSFHVVGEPEAVRIAVAKHAPNSEDAILWEAVNFSLQRLCDLAQRSPGIEVEVDGYLDGTKEKKEWIQLRINVKSAPVVT